MTYRTQSLDTSIEAEQFQIKLLRQAGPLQRLRQARSLTASTRQMSWATLRRLRPALSISEAARAYVELVYGKEIAANLRLETGRETNLMLSQDLVDAIMPVVEALESLGVPYLIGGSVASSLLGIPRSTNDADLVADLQPGQIAGLIAALQADYYISETAIREALSRKSSFNLIHQTTMLKVDIFIPRDEPFDRAEMGRVIRNPLVEGADAPQVNLSSAEDMVLRKLDWYRRGGEVSEKQWLDVLGILKMQQSNLDLAYLKEWAKRLNLTDLLERSLQEAGF